MKTRVSIRVMTARAERDREVVKTLRKQLVNQREKAKEQRRIIAQLSDGLKGMRDRLAAAERRAS